MTMTLPRTAMLGVAALLCIGTSGSVLSTRQAPSAGGGAAAKLTVPRAELGINVAPSIYYNTERTFANLAYSAGGWAAVGPAGLNAFGNPLDTGMLQMNVPQTIWARQDTVVACSWKGAGRMFADGQRLATTYGDHKLTMKWRGWNGGSRPEMFLKVTEANAADPLRDIDCREPGVAVVGPFDQRAVDDLKPYGVLRFLDWSVANGNPAKVTWATRTTPEMLTQKGSDGVAIENMVDLANAAGSDAWFTVPYNADDDYVRNLARLVHDRLAPGHRAYFELSNEPWNGAFGVSKQLATEGVEEGLASERYEASFLRYAERSIAFHKLLTPAFRDDPKRLVRVVNVQNGNAWGMGLVLGFKDLPAWIDAVATAPYFGNDLLGGANWGVTDEAKLFAALDAKRVQAIDQALQLKVAAARYGKRFIAYEGGQHIIGFGPALTMSAQMQRSPAMYEMYRRYIADWNRRIGDTLTLYSATGSISQFGSWGIREYAGQPLAETPKRRAALEFGRGGAAPR